jgi:hypothetical protein
MRRREFIAGLGAAASLAAWSMAALGQQGSRVRRVGVLMNGTADDPLSATGRSAFLQGLQQFGWTEGRNLRIKTVVLTHLTAKPDDDYTAWANEVKKHFSGQVLIAKDLMEF